MSAIEEFKQDIEAIFDKLDKDLDKSTQPIINLLHQGKADD